MRITRLGRDGRPFGLLKLRSMSRDAERMKEALRHLNTMAWPDFKIADDPRVTRLGRVLRKYSLDELPQLYNVLRGEMTLVGPRPCSVKLADYDLWQSERLDVTPGLVGRWQAEGRGSMDFAERCRLDIHQARSKLDLAQHPAPRGDDQVGLHLEGGVLTMDLVALSSRVARRWWVVVGLAALAALGAATAGAGKTDDHRTRIQFVLRPDASVTNGDLPGTLDALKSDGTLVQTVLGVLRNRAILRRAADDADVSLNPAYTVDSTVQPGSTLIDSTLAGPDRSVLNRLAVGYAREASTYVTASYAAYVLERISTDTAPDGTGPGTAQVVVLAALLGAALGILLLAAEMRLEPRFKRRSARGADTDGAASALGREPEPGRSPSPSPGGNPSRSEKPTGSESRGAGAEARAGAGAGAEAGAGSGSPSRSGSGRPRARPSGSGSPSRSPRASRPTPTIGLAVAWRTLPVHSSCQPSAKKREAPESFDHSSIEPMWTSHRSTRWSASRTNSSPSSSSMPAPPTAEIATRHAIAQSDPTASRTAASVSIHIRARFSSEPPYSSSRWL